MQKTNSSPPKESEKNWKIPDHFLEACVQLIRNGEIILYFTKKSNLHLKFFAYKQK